jgi:uncharacterized protein (DUF342 family)
VNEEENIPREFRRQKNRLLSKRLKEKREKIEKVEEEEINLQNEIKYLKLYKNHLTESLDEDPLINLINNKNISLFVYSKSEYTIESVSVSVRPSVRPSGR